MVETKKGLDMEEGSLEIGLGIEILPSVCFLTSSYVRVIYAFEIIKKCIGILLLINFQFIEKTLNYWVTLTINIVWGSFESHQFKA